MNVSEADSDLISPYRFEPACSPHLAAELAGTEININRIVSALQELTTEYETVLVEGAGGVMVPLNRNELMLDLMRAINFPVVLVARPGLGTINHTLLSIRALREAGLDIAGVIFVASQEREPGFIEEDNAVTIEQFGNVPMLGTIPFCAALRDPAPNYSVLPVPVVAEIEKIVNKLIT